MLKTGGGRTPFVEAQISQNIRSAREDSTLTVKYDDAFVVHTYRAFMLDKNRKWKTKSREDLEPSPFEVAVIMELVGDGETNQYKDLDAYICHHATNHLMRTGTWVTEVQRFAAEIAAGMQWIQRIGIVHRDLKPDNCLLKLGTEGQRHMCITDFGGATLSDRVMATAIGNPNTSAPELVRARQGEPIKHDATCDVWSFGATVAMMLAAVSSRAADGKAKARMPGNWESGLVPTVEYLDTHFGDIPRVGELLRKTLQTSTLSRPDFAQILKHNFFEQWDYFEAKKNETLKIGPIDLDAWGKAVKERQPRVKCRTTKPP
jgi:serine/threonine protein kinase